MRIHFKHLTNLKEQLAAMGKHISDEDYTDVLLASLPASYDTSCSPISHSVRLRTKPLTADTFQSMIVDDYMRREIKKNKSNTNDKAFAADAPKPKKQCSNCNKRGHVKADCWAKGGGKEGQGPKKKKNNDVNDKAALAEEKEKDLEAWVAIEVMDNDNEDQDNYAAAAGSSPAQPEHARGATPELYDSGASNHMSPFRDRFVSYQTIPL